MIDLFFDSQRPRVSPPSKFTWAGEYGLYLLKQLSDYLQKAKDNIFLSLSPRASLAHSLSPDPFQRSVCVCVCVTVGG